MRIIKKIEKAIYLAKHKDVQLLIFPECSLTGYPPRDISNSSCVNFNLVQSMCDRLQSVADQMIFLLLSEPYLKKKKYIIEHYYFSLINKSSLMTSGLYGDGIMIISQRGIVME